MVFDHVTDAIGHTPLVKLSRLFPAEFEVFAKLELCNPGGSVKDRPARFIIERCLAEGTLRPGMHVVESSSGNFAIALAMLCNRHGLRFTAIVDPKISAANLALIGCHGGAIEKVDQTDSNGGYLGTRIARARQLVANDPTQTFWVNQYANPHNCQAHFDGEGSELADALASSPPDLLVLGVSTSGTLHGIARRLRQSWPRLRVVAVDAAGSVLFGSPPRARELPGIGASRVPELLCPAEVDAAFHVDDYDAAIACRELVLREGIFAGGSSGAVIAVLQRLARHARAPCRVVTVLPDRGDRYLDTVYDDAWLARMYARRTTAPCP